MLRTIRGRCMVHKRSVILTPPLLCLCKGLCISHLFMTYWLRLVLRNKLPLHVSWCPRKLTLEWLLVLFRRIPSGEIRLGFSILIGSLPSSPFLILFPYPLSYPRFLSSVLSWKGTPSRVKTLSFKQNRDYQGTRWTVPYRRRIWKGKTIKSLSSQTRTPFSHYNWDRGRLRD